MQKSQLNLKVSTYTAFVGLSKSCCRLPVKRCPASIDRPCLADGETGIEPEEIASASQSNMTSSHTEPRLLADKCGSPSFQAATPRMRESENETRNV